MSLGEEHYRTALELAIRTYSSAIHDCGCKSCEDEREQMFDYWLREADEALRPPERQTPRTR